MFTRADAAIAATIFKLLRGATSLSVVRDFLRSKGLAVSAANWDDLYTRRIEPALQDEDISIDDLRDLLRSVEECGRQHVFLYQCAPERAAQMIAPRRLQRVVTELGLSELMTRPLQLELPDQPRIVDIRGTTPTDQEPVPSIIVKQVETRTTRTYLRTEIDEANQQESRIYSVIKKRAVNIARLYEDGRLDIRISSQDNSTRYHDNINLFLRAIHPIILNEGFSPVSLAPTKKKIWDERRTLTEEIRYTNSEARNDFGFTINLSSGTPEDDLSGDGGSNQALQSFLDNDGHVTKSNFYFIIPGHEENREVHVLLSGEINEFAIPASCTEGDYEYVRRKIHLFNA